MSSSRSNLAEYNAFIANPQREGVWSMRIDLSEKQAATLTSFLNLGENTPARRYSVFGTGRYDRYGDDERPPFLFARLFAYLRAALPRAEREGAHEVIGRETGQSVGQRLRTRRVPYFLTELMTPPAHLMSVT
jgi:hypothetical protein